MSEVRLNDIGQFAFSSNGLEIIKEIKMGCSPSSGSPLVSGGKTWTEDAVEYRILRPKRAGRAVLSHLAVIPRPHPCPRNSIRSDCKRKQSTYLIKHPTRAISQSRNLQQLFTHFNELISISLFRSNIYLNRIMPSYY